jgi:hypothetical protein
MKSLYNTNSKQQIFKTVSMLLLAAFLNLIFSCTYFKVRTIEDMNADLSKQQLQKYQNLNKYFILHSGDRSWHITILKVDADKKVMECLLDSVAPAHFFYQPDLQSNKRYKSKKGENIILNDIHIVASKVNPGNQNKISIPLSSISRIDIIDPDTGRIVASYVFTIFGISTAVLGLLIIIILLTKSSCPFIYVNDGQSYIFKGEIYGGAIFKPLERDDYMHLKSVTLDEKEFKIKLTNELLERQYTNLLKTVLVEHDLNTKAYVDAAGNIHTTADLQTAQTAVLNNSKDLKTELSALDSSYCLFDVASKNHNVNDLVLKFHKPKKAEQAKLVLHAKNSLWLDYAFTEFTKLFGSSYNSFIKKQRTANRDSLLNWTYKQSMPLSVYVKENDQWKLVEHIPTVGPLAARDICVPVNISAIQSDDVEIKISCGFMFWELDYAAIDFSSDVVTLSTELQLQNAIDENGTDVSQLLAQTDALYLVQPQPGSSVQLTFHLPQLKKEKMYDVFLHTRGYYEHVRDYEGLPNKNYLMTFKQEGAFIDFAKMLYDKVIDNSGLSALK